MLDQHPEPSALPAWLTQEDIDTYAAAFRRSGFRGGLNWYRGMWMPDWRAPRERIVTVPTTYLWGKGDQALGRRAAELTGRYVRAKYRFVELNENHWLPENAPETVAREIIASVSVETVRYQAPDL